jgi:hypothetical protein
MAQLIVAGALLRATANVNLRNGSSVANKRLATVQAGVLMRALGPVVTGWVEVAVEAYRHSDYPDHLFSEPDQRSSVEARRGATDWEPETLRGYVSSQFVVVVDGPESTS